MDKLRRDFLKLCAAGAVYFGVKEFFDRKLHLQDLVEKSGYREVLNKHFTDAACDAFRKYPLEAAIWYPGDQWGYSPNGSTLQSIATLMLLSWPKRKVILSEESFHGEFERRLVHEYCHKAQEEGLIDMGRFASAYEKMKAQESCAKVVSYTEILSARNILQELVDWPKNNERVCNIATMISIENRLVPHEMHEVYQKTLRISEAAASMQGKQGDGCIVSRD